LARRYRDEGATANPPAVGPAPSAAEPGKWYGSAGAEPLRGPRRRSSGLAGEIRTAFRRLAAQHHPDRNPDDADAAERFKEINLAHQILSDPDKRAAFDRWGTSAFARGGTRARGGFVDLGSVEGIFGDFLEAIGMRTADRGDVRQHVKLSLVDAALGCTREVSYTRVRPLRPMRG
jgi:molecular chaperone DnaJ